MFKKIKYENGYREIYLGKLKIFKYLNVKMFFIYQFLKVHKKFEGIIHNKGFYHFEFLLKRALIDDKYHHIFYDFYYKARNGGGGDLVFVDGGAHAGVFSDVALACGGICYAFEPNIYLATFLKELYEDNKNLVFSQNALGTENKTAMFYNCANDLTSQGNSIIRANDAYNNGYAVQVIDFCEFLQKIITKHKNISLIKLDIEGAEFDILERLIELDLHEKIEYIMVETHERYFDDGAQKMQKLKNLINSKNIKNIFLDWV